MWPSLFLCLILWWRLAGGAGRHGAMADERVQWVVRAACEQAGVIVPRVAEQVQEVLYWN